MQQQWKWKAAYSRVCNIYVFQLPTNIKFMKRKYDFLLHRCHTIYNDDILSYLVIAIYRMTTEIETQ